jgi:hypothetical protein
MTNIKFIASQAKTINLYKNTRSKLLKCCAQFHVKDLYIFVEGPVDDSNGIETRRPSPKNNILRIVVFDLTNIVYFLSWFYAVSAMGNRKHNNYISLRN